MKRILCLWLPNWPIQRLRSNRPELQSHLILLYFRHAQRGLCVSACCDGARERGVAPGMPLSEAQTLLDRGRFSQKTSKRRFPPNTGAGKPFGWHAEAHDPHADWEALKNLAWLCECFSPLVGIEEANRPESLLLDATHLAHRNIEESTWLADLRDAFSERGLQTQAGLADTLGLAWAIAHFSASVGATPTIAPAGLTLNELGDFPIAALRLEKAALDLLRQLGVTTVGAFLRLPRRGISARFGVDVLRRFDQALGKKGEVVTAYRPLAPWRAKKLLEYPTGDRAILEHTLQALLVNLGKSLRANELGVMELGCRFEGGTKPCTAVHISLFRPTTDAKHLFQLLQLQLENLTFPEPIETVSVEASRTARLQEHQGRFWHEGSSISDSPRLRGLIERIASRLGPQRISRVKLVRDAQPELAFAIEPMTSSAPDRAKPVRPSTSVRKKSAAGETATADEQKKSPWRMLERPLQLLSPPLAIEVTALAPEGPPARLRWQGEPRRIARCWGPERIDVGWHRGPTVRRNYFRVETDQGERFWIFQDRLRGQWRLHGFFS